MLRDLVQDSRVAARAFAARPAFTVVAVLTVALAIGANTAVFGVLRGIVFRPLPYTDPGRLVTIWPNHFFSYRELLFLREHAAAYTDIGAWIPGWNMTLTGSGDAAKLSGARVTANLFSVLGAPPAAGRLFAPSEETPGADGVVVLSNAVWRTRFGTDSGVTDRRILLDGAPHAVAGVMPADFELYRPQTEVWRLLAANPAEWYYRGNALFAVGRLRPGATVAQARAELRGLMGGMRAAFALPDDFGADADVAPLRDWLLGPVRPFLGVALGAVGFVLLLAGANLASLLLARAAGREREMAVRTALGASRGRLVRQLLTESVLLSGAGGLAGLALARWGVGLATAMLPAGTPFVRAVGLDPVVLAVSVAVIIATGVVFGLAPALTSVRLDTQAVLRGARAGGAGRTGRRTRAALVAAEVAIGTVLLVGAALMTQTLWRLQRVDAGFRTEDVLTLALTPTGGGFRDPAARIAYYDDVFARVGALPGVAAVGAIQHLPLAGAGWGADLEIEEQPLAPGATPPRVAWRIVTGDYFNALGIPLLEGRAFEATDRPGAPPVAIVNRAMARRYWRDGSPVGMHIRAGAATGDGWATIIGVVGDVRHEGLHTESVPELYQPFAQNPLGGMIVAARTRTDPLRQASDIVALIRGIDRDVPIASVQSMAQVAAASVAPRRTVLILLGAFAMVGLVLGIVGTYGVVAHHVAARTREIGIRIAIGAAPRSVVSASLAQGIRLGAAGVVIGLAGALLVGRGLRSFLFDVGATDPATLAGVAALLFGITTVASYLPARRASRVDPVTALRAE